MQTDEAVRHEADGPGGRFVLSVNGAEAELTYRLSDGVMTIDHTFTPPALRGHSLASRLMRAAVDHARAGNLRIAPLCSYAAAWIRRHDDARDLLESGERDAPS